MNQMKFHLAYLGYHYHRYIVIERWTNILLAIVSTGSLAGLFSSSNQKIWAIILVLTQVVTAAKPYLPFSTRIKELDRGIVSWRIIYNDVEKQWKGISTGAFDDDQINEIIYDYEKRWEAVETDILKGDSLPRIEKYIEKADKEKRLYFETMFGGSDEQ